ncbi:hypothetical protein NIES37_44900 [Tolypothrix tenuis PCC 7101]|uniref:Transposase n=1 Tax=Tolypothrix tenuis PCC 7101 TaxID=231146 RepID=A0A1Z4N448_9CYAN|nr:hypothetical protein [Aulosira sp. FACHB-113]BAZ00498.1 hypothetical protein NIES37_44900 [Tolypothrix tenuis PCC 7101]BAZ75580.1 hypothetical protein NIES50_41680 [Aulosira laxa NIES-50]
MTYYTKKDLEREYKIADTTVYRTLKACGLSTARRKYTAEEITTRFKVARQMFEERYTVKDVAEHFEKYLELRAMNVPSHTTLS